jgi:4-hydroxybenzoyl-CoA thioesterase
MHSSIYRVTVEFGDCDPARIVFYPNYTRWIDSSTRHLFVSYGAAWEAEAEQYGILGMPLVEVSIKFLNPATFGEHLEIESHISEMARKTFAVEHEVRRGATILARGREVRIFGIPHPEDQQRIKAMTIPDHFPELLEVTAVTSKRAIDN